MSLRDPKSLVDGFSSIRGGMDSGTAPDDIGRSKVAFARNVTFRGGFPSTRPGWLQRTLQFPDATTQTRFEDGLFQGASAFLPFNGGEKLVASIGGRLFRIDVDNRYAVSEISITNDLNPADRPKSWFEQAEDFLIVQDGESAALIYDGTTLRRVNPSSVPKEVPVGTVMSYANGRLWVSRPQGKSFVAGDLVYGESGTSAYNFRNSVLKFTENDFLNEGGEFGVPFNAGPIRAMRPIANLDTSLGQGPLQVLTELGGFSVNAPFDRTTWKDLQYPIQTTSLLGVGASSHEASVLVNGDIWFRSGDGIRSFQVARRDFGTWVNTPLSSEMLAVIKDDDPNLFLHASGILFDNRLLMTVSPYRVNDHGIAHRGLIALDFHNVSGIAARTTPVYDGLWTGLNILQLVPLSGRCFIFRLNADNKIELWELTRSDPHDNISTRISCYIDTPAFGFGDTGWNRKELSTGDLWFDDIIGTVNFNVYFWPDQHPCRDNLWHSWSVDSKQESCSLTGACPAPSSLSPQYRSRMRLPLPSDSCNARVNILLRHFFEVQARIAWVGHGRIKKFRVISHEVQEDTLPYCEPSESTDTDGITCCDTGLWSYSSG